LHRVTLDQPRLMLDVIFSHPGIFSVIPWGLPFQYLVNHVLYPWLGTSCSILCIETE
jgi:hypothetical protein